MSDDVFFLFLIYVALCLAYFAGLIWLFLRLAPAPFFRRIVLMLGLIFVPGYKRDIRADPMITRLVWLIRILLVCALILMLTLVHRTP
jgi:hypothetical protein